MLLPTLQSLDITPGKRVMVRADLDVDTTKSDEIFRLKTLIPTLQYLADKQAKIVIIGHFSRPEGKVVESMRLVPVEQKLREMAPNINFTMLENLRFDPGEESNDPVFAQKLAAQADFYVNESFATSHRAHASIVGLPKLLPHAAGLRFVEEVANIGKVLENPEKPVIAIISGIKKDKLDYVEEFKKFCDQILIGGRLPEFLGEDYQSDKVIVAKLVQDKEDITLNSIDLFKTEIAKAGTIILAGACGKYEDPGHLQGTKEVFEAVANSSAYKIVGGGDSLCVIGMFNFFDKFNWVSVGGGAMLEFLAKGTLPGIEALLS
jgi:phosphoglycerate kinase